MNFLPAIASRGLFGAVAAIGAAYIVAWQFDGLQSRIHGVTLLAIAGLLAISESHFKSLLSELSALLRRGSYSVYQLEQLNQTVPNWRKRASFAWSLSMWLKAGVGVAAALLLWDGLSTNYRTPVIFFGYMFLFYSLVFAEWARRNYRKLEREVDALTLKEASLKEKRKLTQALESGASHDFSKDELAKGYTNPPKPI